MCLLLGRHMVLYSCLVSNPLTQEFSERIFIHLHGRDSFAMHLSLSVFLCTHLYVQVSCSCIYITWVDVCKCPFIDVWVCACMCACICECGWDMPLYMSYMPAGVNA